MEKMFKDFQGRVATLECTGQATADEIKVVKKKHCTDQECRSVTVLM